LPDPRPPLSIVTGRCSSRPI